MPLLQPLKSLLRNLFGRQRVEQDLDAEMQASLQMLEDEHAAEGLDPAAARRAARLHMGGVEQVKESVREVRRGRLLEEFWQDARHGARLLRNSPGFTAVALLTLALGAGVTTAIFTVVQAVLLRPLPYNQPDRLAVLNMENTRRGWKHMPLPAGAYWEFQEQSRSLAGLAVFRTTSFTLLGGEEPQRIRGSLVTANLFAVLGVGPQLGRGFLPEEDRPGGASVCVISNGLWQRYFGAAPDAIGQTLRLEDNTCEVVGVTPARFNFPEESIDVLQPLQLPPGQRQWGSWSLFGVARLEGETPYARAQAEVNTVAQSFAEHMPFGSGWEFVLTPLEDRVLGGVRKELWVLFGTAGFVLLIASVNLANLLLARMNGRSRELAVRAALGAGRGRLLRQVLSENLMLAVLGSVLSVALAAWVVDLFRWLAPDGFPRMEEIKVDGGVLSFALAASLLAVLLAGWIPSRQVMRRGLTAGLREGMGARGIAGGRTRAHGTLVGAEVALAVVLLMGAGLLLRSMHQLLNVHTGMTSENVLTMIIQLPPRYAEAARFTFFHDLEQRIQSLPGVTAVGLTTGLPTQGVQVIDSLTVEGAPPVDPDARPNVAIDIVSPGYFQAAGIPLLDGELFTAQGAAVPGGIVINEAIARRYFPGRSAVGKRVLSSDDKTWLPITGVVGNVKQFGLRVDPPLQIYKPHEAPGIRGGYLVIRSTSDPTARIADIKSVVRSMDQDLPLTQVRTMTELISDSVGRSRTTAVLMASFAGLALVLAVVGIYGVMAYAAGRRTQEIGVRLALGAQPLQILRLVIGQGILPAIIGLAAGVVAATWLTKLLSSLLFEVSPTDTLTFAAVAALLLAVAVLACYVPARRASKVDVIVALRYE